MPYPMETTGPITNIDHARGDTIITVDHSDVYLREFPSTVNLSVGDTVTVRLHENTNVIHTIMAHGDVFLVNQFTFRPKRKATEPRDIITISKCPFHGDLYHRGPPRDDTFHVGRDTDGTEYLVSCYRVHGSGTSSCIVGFGHISPSDPSYIQSTDDGVFLPN